MKHPLDPIETQSLEETQSANPAMLLQALRFAQKNSSFWTKKFNDLGFDTNVDVTLSNFQKLPLLDKDEILKDQLDKGPYGDLLAVDQKKLVRIHRTSGTTAAPLMVLLSHNDVQNVVTVGARAFRCAGVSLEDTIIHCLNYCMWAGGYTDHQSLENAGATVVPFGVGNSQYLIQTILRLRPSALSCTPSYLTRLEQVLHDEFNMPPIALGLKKAFLGGEGGLQDSAVRDRIEKKWGMSAIDANYGLSDVLSIIGSECNDRSGLHFHALDMLYPELVDQDGALIEIKSGAIGELVITNLRREAQPLFRYRTHDIIKIESTDFCSCGRRGFRFHVVGRSDDMVTIKGINFFPSSVSGIFSELSELSGDYRIIVRRSLPQDIAIEVERAPNCEADWNQLATMIQKRISVEYSVLSSIKFVDYGHFLKSENKTKRVIWIE